MSSFVPFSQESKRWEELALTLRARVPAQAGTLAFDPWQLAPKVGLRVIDCLFQGLDNQETQYMKSLNGGHWSGGVLPTPLPDGTRICMLNPDQSPRRRKITLMEEITHSFLDHTPTVLALRSDQRYRNFNHPQEKEAYGVGAAVLLPWKSFFPLLNQGTGTEELSDCFDVSEELIKYRIKVCGATRLYLSRHKRAS
jgi:hypothetical protein